MVRCKAVTEPLAKFTSSGRGRVRATLPSSAQYGSEFQYEVDTDAAELNLTEPYIPDGYLHIRCDEDGQGVTDPHFDAYGQIEGREQVIGVVVILHVLDAWLVEPLVIIVAVLAGHQIGRQAGGSEEERIAGDAEIIAKVQGDFEHAERSFDKIDIGRTILSHIILAIKILRRMKVLGRGGIVLPAQQETGADMPVMSELVICRQPDGAAGFISGHGADGGEIGCDEHADLQGSVDIQAALSLDRGRNGLYREGAQGGVRD